MTYQFEPTVVVARSGSIAVALTEFEGVHRIANRDAVGFYFTARSAQWSDKSRLAVLFSGTSLMSDPQYFGLPDYQDRDANFAQFAFAALGDYLDEVGVPPETPSGTPAAHIEAFSGRFQEWKRRPGVSDDEVLAYMKARLFWTWKYGAPRTLFSSHDLLRLGAEVGDLHRLAHLEEGHAWNTHSKSAYGISLEPTPELLRSERLRLDPSVNKPSDKPQPPKQDLPPAPAPSPPPAIPASPKPAKPARPAARKKKATSASKRRKGKGRDATALVFVDDVRLSDLRAINSDRFDLRKVVAICDELNVCYRSQCYLSVAALTRTLLDHVPPIFGVDSFAKVANNYSGGRSFRGSMQHLELSARNIADGHLHIQIRKRESLPSRTQVNFAADVDVLLAEIVRILT